MAEVTLIRHAQASFGEADYDRLSKLGHEQSKTLGDYLSSQSRTYDRVVLGTMRRHFQTAASAGLIGPFEAHQGFNEYDFGDLLACRYPDGMPEEVGHDRRGHFRVLRDTIGLWQNNKIDGVAETYEDFQNRTRAAMNMACRDGAKTVAVVTSGGPIGQIVADTLGAPPSQMIALNLQVKNTSISRMVYNVNNRFLHEFNATPHLDAPAHIHKLTYS